MTGIFGVERGHVDGQLAVIPFLLGHESRKNDWMLGLDVSTLLTHLKGDPFGRGTGPPADVTEPRRLDPTMQALVVFPRGGRLMTGLEHRSCCCSPRLQGNAVSAGAVAHGRCCRRRARRRLEPMACGGQPNSAAEHSIPHEVEHELGRTFEG